MKLKKYIACSLGICLLLTGCGRAQKASSDIEASAEPESVTEEFYDITETSPIPEYTVITTSKAQDTTTALSETVTASATTAVMTEENDNGSDSSGEENDSSAQYEDNNDYEPQQQSYEPPVTTQRTVNTSTEKSTTAVRTTAIVTTTTINHDPSPQEVLSELTLEQKVGQMFMVTPEALTGISPMREVGNGTKNALAAYPVGGIIYFAQNLTSQDQIRTMIRNTQSYSRSACGVGLFTAVDEEGGTVARCAQKLGTASFSNMAHYGRDNDYGTAYGIGSALGRDLHSLGFNVDFAPVADVDICSGNELGDRIFSSDPDVVANMVCGVTMGLQDNGVCATLKHFPGLGAEDGNTHTNSTVIIDRSVKELRETEFIPFKAAIDKGADFVMVGHQTVTGFGDDLPCDLSYTAVTEMLRGELGFDGIAVTDAHQMNTISKVYSSGEAAKLSIKAGMDIILMPVDHRAAIDEVCRAVRSGEIPESRIDESVMRILSRKYQLGLLKR
ncbi:MAG: hypothetical protein IKN66_00180 [Ruminococcus sp.]|nr:hypothetical protein [Ruminococcus sp.]